MEEPIQVKPDKMQFDELMFKIRNGQIRIPDFQREFVWERSQILSLLDSVYHHFPIGSFLFWQTEDKIQSYRHVGEVELRSGNGKSVQYVLDGQQRLTSLFASLEQARIAHRVNGKKVTKNLRIYFDLDTEQFVSDPFSKDHEKIVPKRVGLPQITSRDDYLSALIELLEKIDGDGFTTENLIQWLKLNLEVSRNIAQRLHGLFQTMDLYTVTHDLCTIIDGGREVIREMSARPVIRGLLHGVEYFDKLLPKIIEDQIVTEESMVQYLLKEYSVEIKNYKVRSRLKWLAGLGLGTFKAKQLTLSNAGKSTIDELLREIEIRERNLQQQEEDKKKRYFSVRQITDVHQFVEVAAGLGEKRRLALSKVVRRFTNYPFSVIDVFEQPIETACEIFERINTSGKVLNLVDLMVAKSWSPTFNMRGSLPFTRS